MSEPRAKLLVLLGRARQSLGRRGYTLLEMLFVISLSSVLIGGVAVLLAELWRAQDSIDDQNTALNSVVRMAQQFRTDVHQATAVEFSATAAETRSPPFTIALSMQQKVEYRSEVGRIVRVLHSGDEIKQRESYSLPADASVKWQVATNEGVNVASLSITRPMRPGLVEPSSNRVTRIDAVVGREPQQVNLKPVEP